MLTSRQHPLVKEFRRIARGDAALSVLDGWHLLREAADSGVDVKTVGVVRGDAAHNARTLSALRARGAEIVEVSPSVMEAMSPVRSPSGVVALVMRRDACIEELLQSRPALLLLAVDMQDPGNVGALVRAAEAGGATGVFATGTSADPWGWKALRASMGSTLRLPVSRAKDTTAVIEEVRRTGVRVLAAVPRGGTLMHDVTMTSDIALLVGGEGPGLPPMLVDGADERVSIPMRAAVESLNVAVAAALLVYEARRQREVK